MPFDITNTHHLLAAIEQTTPVSSFLRDRYFPCNPSTDIFTTDDVIVEYKKGHQKMAPFVAPRVGGKTILRKGYRMERYEPANIAPKRPLTLDDLQKKGFGEAFYSQLTPEQRAGAIVTKDLLELEETIIRREEDMAAEVMQTNALVMRHYGDNDEDYEEKEVFYYDGETNPAVFTPTVSWSDPSADIFADLQAVLEFAEDEQVEVTELLIPPHIAPMIIKNNSLKEYLNIEGYKLGHIEPRKLNEQGASYIGTVNVLGNMVDFISYGAKRENDEGKKEAYLNRNIAVATTPACGRTVYGAVTQMERDENYHTYAAKRVPKYTSDIKTDTRELKLTSRPLMMPNKKNCFIAINLAE